jgi:hypothetical protein
VSRRSGVVIGLAAVTLLLARAAHADDVQLAQAWPPTGAPAEPAPVSGPRVTLRVDNPNGRLQQHTQLRWRDICIAPCGVTVDPTALYRVGGGTSLPSEAFSLPRASGDVFIDAEVGSKVKHWVGLGLMIGGVVAAGYGFIFWQFFNSFAPNDTTPTAQDARSFGRTVGIVFLSVGAVLEAVGLPMFFSDTSVQVR